MNANWLSAPSPEECAPFDATDSSGTHCPDRGFPRRHAPRGPPGAHRRHPHRAWRDPHPGVHSRGHEGEREGTDSGDGA